MSSIPHKHTVKQVPQILSLTSVFPSDTELVIIVSCRTSNINYIISYQIINLPSPDFCSTFTLQKTLGLYNSFMMAVDLHNSDQLLLPSRLDALSVLHTKPINQNASYLFASPDSRSGSELSSPICSDQLSSISTESRSEEEEEDDYIRELTHQMTQYMLEDEDNKHEKPWGLFGSNLDSPVGPSEELSPPLTPPMIMNFEKMKINDGFQSKQALIDDQIRAIQFFRLKQEQAMKQIEQKPRNKNYQRKGRVFGGLNNGQKVSPNSNNPWYTLQQQQRQQSNQQAGSDMRAVFLNASSGSRNGSCGTGVFLPRGGGIGTPSQSRNKQGCATVLIPARVVQALKLHFERTGVPSRFNNGGFSLEHDASVSGTGRDNSMYSRQKRQHSTTVPAMNHKEMGLPQEWTY